MALTPVGAVRPFAEVARAALSLVGVHIWDGHGAVRAGLVGGLATRPGAVPEVVDRLLALPA
ncbi:hypothetical protein BJF78_31820 [Pseudonocardia sp. CNS-139]|nr:hypothetical protein BJF78_31820 [Pseudonocardia sp. CNS-139]